VFLHWGRKLNVETEAVTTAPRGLHRVTIFTLALIFFNFANASDDFLQA
jgi:hypothetical protein